MAPVDQTKYFYDLTPERVLAAVENFGFRCTGRVFSLHSMENRVYEAEIELAHAYESLRQFDHSTLRLIEGLRALRMIHYAAWIGRRWEDPAFKRTFPHFGTNSYWREQLGDLQEQLELLQGATD